MESDINFVREIRVNYLPTAVNLFPIRKSADVAEFARSVLTDNSREHFIALFLNGNHRVAAYSLMGIGTANFCPVRPTEVYQRAILCGASAVVCAHNHPSNELTPSEEDWKMTRLLRECGQMLGVRLLDHVIISDHDEISLAGLSRWGML